MSKLQDKVRDHLHASITGKDFYKIADELLDELVAKMKPGQVVKIPHGKLAGKSFRLVDKFAQKNRIGVGMSARRYEFEEVKPEKKKS